MLHAQRATLLTLAILVAGTLGATTASAAFELKNTQGDHLDVFLDGKPVARYMYAYDTSTPERRLETYKPYLHILDPATGKPITKGPGGLYPHHRGIFIGWKATTVNGKKYDTWHMKPGDMVHQKFLKTESGDNEAAITALIHWNDGNGKPLVIEERTMTFRRPPTDKGIVLVDFTSTLKPAGAVVNLRGDPEHAGVQYRPHDEVSKNKSATYVFPEERITTLNVGKERDMPWAALAYTLGGQTYSVQEMNHPSNPKGSIWSAYRDYGRFGPFFQKKIPAGESLTIRYRFIIMKGPLPPRETLQTFYDAFAK